MRTVALRVLALLLLLAVGLPSAALPTVDLAYTLRFEPRPAPAVAVEAQFTGGPGGFTVLGACVLQWLPADICAKSVTDLRLHAVQSGRSLILEQVDPNIWIADHAPGEQLVLRYRLVSSPDPHGSVLAPRIGSEQVRFLADTGLVVPEHLLSRTELSIRLDWEGEHPPGWTAASSFGLDQQRVALRLPLREALRGLLYLGELVSESTAAGTCQACKVAWLGKAPPSSERRRFAATFDRLRAALAGQLPPGHEPTRLVFVLPANRTDVLGIAVGPSVLLVAPSSGAFAPGAGALSLAHEMVHTVPAGALRVSEAPVPETFFAEAVAELLSRRTLLRAGFISLDEWVAQVNEKLKRLDRDHSITSARSSPATADPYVLGDLLLIRIDRELHRRSGASVLDLLTEASAHGPVEKPLPWPQIRNALAARTSDAFADEVDGLLRGQRPLRFPQDAFGGCLHVDEVPEREFDLGFDLERSIAERLVTGIRHDGAAKAAGLREGEPLLRWDVVRDRPDVPVRLVVLRDGQPTPVSFMPAGDPVEEGRQVLAPIEDPQTCSEIL